MSKRVSLEKRVYDIEFIADTHTYLFNGQPLKSVTTLLSELGVSPDYSEVNEETLEKAKQRGIRIHKEIEEYIKFGKETESTELQNFINWLNEKDYVVIGSEVIVHNDILAGTIDLILLNKWGERVIYDIKTTSIVHKYSVEWQNSLYTFLDNQDYVKNGCLHFDTNGDLHDIELAFQPRENLEMVCEELRLGITPNLPTVYLDKELTDNIYRAMNLIKNANESIAQAEKFLTGVRERALIEMEKHGVKKFENNLIKIVYVAPFTKETIDSKKLKETYPEIAKECKKVTNVKARVDITLKKIEDEDENEEN